MQASNSLTVALCGLVLIAMSARSGAETTTANKPVDVGFSHAPPWAFALGEGCVAGINAEIIAAALDGRGYDIRFRLSGYRRMVEEFADGHLDIASPMAIDIENAHYTDRYLPYRDVAITQRQRGLDWRGIPDLAGNTVVAYQKAIYILPDEFRQMAEAGAFNYTEHPDRRSQILMLSTGRVDAVIGEVRILMYHTARHYSVDEVEEQNIFPEVHYGASVWGDALYADFQAGLDTIRANGRYARIFERYDQPIPALEAMLQGEHPQCFDGD